jgi:hypothetical protein
MKQTGLGSLILDSPLAPYVKGHPADMRKLQKNNGYEMCVQSLIVLSESHFSMSFASRFSIIAMLHRIHTCSCHLVTLPGHLDSNKEHGREQILQLRSGIARTKKEQTASLLGDSNSLTRSRRHRATNTRTVPVDFKLHV